MAAMISLVSRLFGEIKRNGFSNTYYKVKEKRAKNLALKDYDSERLAVLPSEAELEAQKKRNFVKDITFSIVVPTFHTPEIFLRQMIESVLGQTFCRVELCIADGSSNDCVERIVSEYAQSDERIKYQRLGENKGISENTNEGLKMASGDYIGLLDHDDVLERHALYEIRMAIAKNPQADVIYTDEDKVSMDLQHYFEPHYKPDFNPDLLRSNNYICHFLMMKRELLEKAGGFRSEYDGAQDYDLVLRLTEQAESIVHIPQVLYHWRCHEASTAANPASKLYAYDAGRRAVEAHLKRCGESGIVTDTRFYGFYQTKYEIPEKLSFKTVICSSKDQNPKKILNIFSGDFRGQIAGNVIYYDNGFNKIVINSLDETEEAEVIVFADSRLSEVSAEGVQQLIVNCMRKNVGLAGGRILTANGELQYGRMETDREGRLTFADAGLPKGFTGYFHKAVLQQNTEGVSHYLFAIRKDLLTGWNPKEAENPEAQMISLCDHVKEEGWRISYVPSASAVLK